MCLSTSGKGIYHNMQNWKFDYLGDFKIMEQDSPSALLAFEKFGPERLYNKLKDWNFDKGSFSITKDDYEDALSAMRQLAEFEEKNRRTAACA